MPRSPRILNAALLALLSGAGLEAREIPIFVSGKDRLYSTLSTEDPQLVTVRGPGELRLVSRARFAPGTEGPLRYSLLVRLDGGTEQEVAYERVEPSRTAVFRDSNLGCRDG